MPNLVPRRTQSDPLLNAQVADAQVPSLVAAARIQSAAFATNVAIQQAAMLSMAVSRAFELSPAGEHVYNALFLAFGSVAATEIQRLGMYQGGRS